MLFMHGQQPDLEQNPLLRWLRSHMRVAPGFHGQAFFVHIDGVRHATPMFLVLLMIEASDLVFAVDSIPAIFAVTTDPFIVFTSNIFAILGLRALYFLLADMAERFYLLKYGLALVLIYIGGKMLAMPWFHMPAHWSLASAVLVLWRRFQIWLAPFQPRLNLLPHRWSSLDPGQPPFSSQAESSPSLPHHPPDPPSPPSWPS